MNYFIPKNKIDINNINIKFFLFLYIPNNSFGIVKDKQNQYYHLTDKQIFLSLEQVTTIKPSHNQWTIEKADIFSCIKLVAYIDYALANHNLPNYSNQSVVTKNHMYILDACAGKDIQTLLINTLLTPYRTPLQPLIEAMRNHECYWITRHLLNQMKQNINNITEIRLKYGVSETHFRRLCHQYLGLCGKKQLRSWRATSAILSIILKNKPLTNIALDYGFSSASHLSKEIKVIFGATPKSFRLIRKSFYED
ncbi:helix-turn-helix domain-containing protein [Arsenophonus apicola]|uniref:helix-turn-helix domain-containing protein n=1 Tax=Arsenophonus apicola TaxID=2879119 RepID=UPI0038797E8E